MENAPKGGTASLTVLVEEERRANTFGHLSLLVLFSKDVLCYQPAKLFGVFMEYCVLEFCLYSECIPSVGRFPISHAFPSKSGWVLGKLELLPVEEERLCPYSESSMMLNLPKMWNLPIFPCMSWHWQTKPFSIDWVIILTKQWSQLVSNEFDSETW